MLDFTQAFWQIPICPNERRYFIATAILRGKLRWLVRVAALLMVLAQWLFAPDEASLMCYVDDPLAALAGDSDHVSCIAATMTLVWEPLNLPLAYEKGQFGQVSTWIGGTIKC